MCKNDENVSPYLRRPIRSWEEILREQAERARKTNQPNDGPTGPSARDLLERDDDVVAPRK